MGLVIGGVFGGLALGTKSTLDSHCVNKTCPASEQSDIDSLSTKATVSTVGFGVGIVGVAVGAILLGVSHSHEEAAAAKLEPPRPRVSPWIGLGRPVWEAHFNERHRTGDVSTLAIVLAVGFGGAVSGCGLVVGSGDYVVGTVDGGSTESRTRSDAPQTIPPAGRRRGARDADAIAPPDAAGAAAHGSRDDGRRRTDACVRQRRARIPAGSRRATRLSSSS